MEPTWASVENGCLRTYLYPFMDNRGSGHEGCAGVSCSTLTEIHRAEPGVRAASEIKWKERITTVEASWRGWQLYENTSEIFKSSGFVWSTRWLFAYVCYVVLSVMHMRENLSFVVFIWNKTKCRNCSLCFGKNVFLKIHKKNAICKQKFSYQLMWCHAFIRYLSVLCWC